MGSRVQTACDSMSDKTFSRLREFVQTELGIKMPDAKKTMLQSRLLKRLRAVGKQSYEEYCNYVFSSEGKDRELINMIDVITTNKTDFFREPKHFDYLLQTALPELINTRGTGMRDKASIWSAGCSTGEEPYTLAMVLSDFAEKYPGFRYSILATDISTRVLKTAKLAIYDHERVAPIPLNMRKKYLLRSKDRRSGTVRVIPELRSAVRFGRLNFMDNDFGLNETMDIIFCRNVIIYFKRTTQEKVLKRLCRFLHPGGFMFMGHSETLSGLNVPLVPVATTIYRKSR